ncbi:MAG: dihydroxyacetone kinase subunit DhaK [Synergistaceae bacterium]|nr:dihydroxyacetone kinase subunit DhaK [Synergistaceae bacterium]
MHWFSEGREYYARRWFTGMLKAHPGRWRLFDSQIASATLVSSQDVADRVAVIISSGGSDGPWSPGFVGAELADAVVVGAPFTAPNAYAIYEVAKSLDTGRGVILLYNNFMGDYLNNDMAEELLALEGHRAIQIPVHDDMGMARGEAREYRGGRSGSALMTRIAGTASRAGLSLDEMAALLTKANSRMSTLCVSVNTESNLVTFGKGFSEEPGFESGEMGMREAAEETVRLLTEDLSPKPDEQVLLMVNPLRLAGYDEAYVMGNYLYDSLSAKYPVLKMNVGAYIHILDGYGFTVTLLCADSELRPYLEGTVQGDGFCI